MRVLGRTLLATAALAGVACSPLQRSAASVETPADPSDPDPLIPYRRIMRTDFRGTTAPAQFAAEGEWVGAVTCATIITLPKRLVVSRSQRDDGSWRHFGRVERLSFHAMMDRSCSWWNTDVASVAPAYVLQHEQIHFAIYEIAARKLNASARQIAREMESEGATAGEVLAHAHRVHERVLGEAHRALDARNGDFDREIASDEGPERHKVWFNWAMAELDATQAWSTAP